MKYNYKLFDSHFHIIDKSYPLIPNQGYIPEEFTCEQYLLRMKDYNLIGGVVVAGSFQGYDQTYLIDSLSKLGPYFVGVTQLPRDVSDEQIIALNNLGIKAVRFNLIRGGSEQLDYLEEMANRIYELSGWHIELYLDSNHLNTLFRMISGLPAISIDHLGLSKSSFDILLSLVEGGARVKASGFGRVELNVREAIREIYRVNSKSLMFGTDLPSTRAERPYIDEDFNEVIESVGEESAANIFYDNAIEFYNLNILED